MTEPPASVWTAVIHPDCVCDWEIAEDANGWWRTRRAPRCVIHREIDETIERVARELDSFTCPHCGATSYNSHDVDNRYCGACHHFCDDVGERDVGIWES